MDSSPQRAALTRQLIADGHVDSQGWRGALEAVPRELFLPEFFRKADGGWTPVRAGAVDQAAWLAMVYSDTTWVTQLDGHITPADVDTVVDGAPTSSSSLPSLVAGMWQRLDVSKGMRVLEIGTGSGYSTALGAHRLGDDWIVSVELDPVIAGRAARALRLAGHYPDLRVGDGTAGAVDAAPFDRIIATCAVPRVPAAWIAQTRPGGKILTTLSGPLFRGSAQTLLTVDPQGAARGAFVDTEISFMVDRAVIGQDSLRLPDDDAINRSRPRRTRVGIDDLDVWPLAVVAQWAAPGAQRREVWRGGAWRTMLADDDSFAVFDRDSDGRQVVIEGGPNRLWSAVEEAVALAGGIPAASLAGFELRIDAEGTHRVVGANGRGWRLALSPGNQTTRSGARLGAAPPRPGRYHGGFSSCR